MLSTLRPPDSRCANREDRNHHELPVTSFWIDSTCCRSAAVILTKALTSSKSSTRSASSEGHQCPVEIHYDIVCDILSVHYRPESDSGSLSWERPYRVWRPPTQPVILHTGHNFLTLSSNATTAFMLSIPTERLSFGAKRCSNSRCPALEFGKGDDRCAFGQGAQTCERKPNGGGGGQTAPPSAAAYSIR